MAKKVSIDNLDKALTETLEEFGNNITYGVKESVLATAKRAVQELKDNSPEQTGDYKKGWHYKKTEENSHMLYVVAYNKTDYQLTHLLEKGHIMVLKGGRTPANGRTWVNPKPHIEKAQESADEYLEAKIKLIVGKDK